MRGPLRRMSISSFALLSIYATGQIPPSATGVTGAVMLSPARPGPQRAGVPDLQAYAAATILLSDANGRVIARGATNPAGRFTVDAPAGKYTVGVDTAGARFPRCEPVELTVH